MVSVFLLRILPGTSSASVPDLAVVDPIVFTVGLIVKRLKT